MAYLLDSKVLAIATFVSWLACIHQLIWTAMMAWGAWWMVKTRKGNLKSGSLSFALWTFPNQVEGESFLKAVRYAF